VDAIGARNSDPVPGVKSPATFGLLRDRQFGAYWLARVLHQTAQGAILYGLLILIADRTDRSIYSSLFVACSIAPSLLFGLVGGWAADRLPQRLTLIVLSVLRVALIVTLLLNSVDLLTIFAVTLGIWTVHQLFSPTETAVLARLVPIDRLSNATSLSNLALTLSQVLGMVMLAPLLLKLSDPHFLFAAVAALYGSAAIFYVRMGRLPTRASDAGRRQPMSLRRGWDVTIADRPAFGAFIDAILIGVGLSTLVVVVPHYLVEVLSTNAGNTVFVFAPAVLGLVAGLQVAPMIGRAIGHGRLATIGIVGFALAIGCLGLVDQVVTVLRESNVDLDRLESSIGLSTRISATMLMSIPAGFFSAVTSVAARTVLLERSPEEARGQVIATQTTASNAVALVPTLIAGVAIDLVGVRPVALAIAALLLAGAVLGRRIGGGQETRTKMVVPFSGPPATRGRKDRK
jgi:MFS family permease